jgi:hypothetical protein
MTEKLDFRISSGLKNIIGKELITNDMNAIFELVKNSYDADATEVKIVFENIKNNGGKEPRILIIDDGNGMSYNDIIEKWLFVGYSEKKEFEKELDSKDFRDKIGKRRVFAGAKGVGRFSCDKLGKHLKLYTKKENENVTHYIYTDWSKFEENPKDEFQTITVDYTTPKKIDVGKHVENFKNGTILEISPLNSSWDQKKLLKLKKYLQRLINPSQIGEVQDFKICLLAEEFLPEDDRNRNKGDFGVINGSIRNIVFEKLNIKTTQISCSIDMDGDKIYTELVDKGTFVFSLEEKNNYPSLRNINIRLSYLNRAAKSTFTRTMGIEPVRYGSIFLYKNGFRIHPYGDEGDDWLELEIRKGQGYARYLGTREVIGRIEVNGYQPNLREVSSRDAGIEKTTEYEQLVEFFFEKALRRLEKYVVEGINWDRETNPKSEDEIKRDSLDLIRKFVGQVKDPEKQVKFNDDLLEMVKEKQVEKLPELTKNLEYLKEYVKDPKEKEYFDTQLKAFKIANRTFTKSKNEEVKKKVREVKTLKGEVKQKEKEILFLTSITGEDEKELIGLQHQVGISTSTINNYLMHLKDGIEKGKTIPNEDLLKVIDKISLESHKIIAISNFVTKANFNLMTEKIEKDLVSFIKQYVENVYTPYKKVAVANENLNIKVNLESDFEFIYNFKPLEIIIILDNLLNNSTKANANNVEMTIGQFNENGMWVKIKDDGIGIPKEHLGNLFDFGYTTTGGSGIGLYHVRQILKKINGSITAHDSLDKGAEFTIKVER